MDSTLKVPGSEGNILNENNLSAEVLRFPSMTLKPKKSHSRIGLGEGEKSTLSIPKVISENIPLKFLFMGDRKCGKTSIAKRVAMDLFEPDYKQTVGVDVHY